MVAIHCPPYLPPTWRHESSTILELAARANRAVEAWELAMDERRDFRTVVKLAGIMARATTELSSAIATEVAENSGVIHLAEPLDRP